MKSRQGRLLLALALNAIVTSVYAQTNSPRKAIKYRTVDCHLHLVDFLQRTEGVKALLKAMDIAGVEEAMLCGMPLIKKWSVSETLQPQYYLDDDSRCYWYSATDILVAR